MKPSFINIVKKCEDKKEAPPKNTRKIIPQHLTRHIIESINFEEVLLHFNFEVQDLGEEIRVLCPFHNDTTPSLDANKDKGVFICRSCGASGSIIDFIKGYLNVGFGEAINIMAAIKGITGFEPKDEIIAAVKQYEIEEARYQKNKELRIGGLTLDDFDVKISSICRDHLIEYPEDWDFIEKVYRKLDIWIREKDRVNLKRLDRSLMKMLREHKEKIIVSRNENS
jgi:hypothetical protein